MDRSPPRNAERRFLATIGAVWLLLFAVSLAFQRPEFRPWELVSVPERHTFLPDQRITMVEVGDLGHTSWVRALQVPRETVFTTDAAGFRNPAMERAPRVVVAGDSHVVGSGLRDEETVTAQLARRLGEPVYNYGMASYHSAVHFVEDPRFRAAPPRVLVFAPAARLVGPLGREKTPVAATRPGLTAEHLPGRLVEILNRDNGLRRQARYLLNGLAYALLGADARDDVIFPDGKPALALSLERQGLLDRVDGTRMREIIASVIQLRDIARSRGIHLVYSPIPAAGTIYPELFEDAALTPRPSFLDRLIDGVREAGVDVVDLRPVYRASRAPYLYLRDDSHWNARATEIAAEAWAPAIRAALGEGGRDGSK